MVDFIEGNFDVLISTMIIESGLDLPNVNTMIVNRADRFGVAQLHQLRGRIGRSSRKAYAYLLVPPKFEMSRIARERLAALTNFSSLGAGFQVAMRDLEIRGAGNLLGREQSGYINAVGFEMYQRLIEEAVREVQTEHGPRRGTSNRRTGRTEAQASTPTPSSPRPTCPRAACGSITTANSRAPSISKAWTRPSAKWPTVSAACPEAAQNLFDMVRVRILGEKLQAEKITIERARVRDRIPHATASPATACSKSPAAARAIPVEFSASGPLTLKLPLGMMQDWRDKLIFTIKFLAALSGVSVMETLTV